MNKDNNKIMNNGIMVNEQWQMNNVTMNNKRSVRPLTHNGDLIYIK